jgi:hypothetical protein
MAMMSRVVGEVRAFPIRSLERGLKGDGVWLAVGFVGLMFRALGYLKRRNEVVYRTTLKPGQRIEIDHLVDSFKALGEKPPG